MRVSVCLVFVCVLVLAATDHCVCARCLAVQLIYRLIVCVCVTGRGVVRREESRANTAPHKAIGSGERRQLNSWTAALVTDHRPTVGTTWCPLSIFSRVRVRGTNAFGSRPNECLPSDARPAVTGRPPTEPLV